MTDAPKRDRMAFRIPSELADELRGYAGAHGVTATEVVTSALTAYLGAGTQEAHAEAHAGTRGAHADSGYDGGEALRALTAQLDRKDEQIARLMDALSQAQQTARAAQVLEGAHVMGTLTGETSGGGDGEAVGTVDEIDSGAHGRSGILQRLRDWLHG